MAFVNNNKSMHTAHTHTRTHTSMRIMSLNVICPRWKDNTHIHIETHPHTHAHTQVFIRLRAIAERPGWEGDQRGLSAIARTIFYGHYRSIFKHCDVIGQKSYRIQWKKCKISDIMPFKVIEVGINRKSVSLQLLISD